MIFLVILYVKKCLKMSEDYQTVKEEALKKQSIQIAMNRQFLKKLLDLLRSEDPAHIGTISDSNLAKIVVEIERHLRYWKTTVQRYLDGLPLEQTQKKVQIGIDSGFFFTFECNVFVDHKASHLFPLCSGTPEMRAQLGEEAYKELWTFTLE